MSDFLNFDDLSRSIRGSVFEEEPVDLLIFIHGETYMNLTKVTLSEEQERLIRMSTQIYMQETLEYLFGPEKGAAFYRKYTKNEVVAMLGKGSGKDFCATLAFAYVVYLLLCLNDPADYYDKPRGNSIDLINIAVNAQQAQTVFFDNFVQLIQSSPWFNNGGGFSDGKRYNDKASIINFDKNVNVYSGHSERESFEGLNLIMVVLDEIAAFAMHNNSGNPNAKTAQATYDMYSASVMSRFDEFGKVISLSFPRHKQDWITQRYAKVVKDCVKIPKTHRFIIDPDFGEVDGNFFDINWTEDVDLKYSLPRTYAIRRASWVVNPTKKIDNYMRAFYDNLLDSLGRFCAEPPDAIEGLFRDHDKVKDAFVKNNMIDDEGIYHPDFQPIPETRYFMHVDLAKKHDRCAVALAHVDHYVQREFGHDMSEPVPVVVIDAIRYWVPTAAKNVDFTDVKNFILDVHNKGFDLKLVTFDRWQSDDIIKELMQYGISSEVLSVHKKHYTEFVALVHEGRVVGPHIQDLIDELIELRITNTDKVDHPRTGYKDLSDASCGAIHNAIAHTPRDKETEIKVVTSSDLRQQAILDREARGEYLQRPLIDPPKKLEPKREMPQDISDWLATMRVV